LNTKAESAAGAFTEDGGKIIASHTSPTPVGQPTIRPAKKKAATVKPKTALAAKTKKQRQGSSRARSKSEKLVCRYCGSHDLAPSFKKRRDARCRACFKKRYGSAARGKSAKRTGRAKAGK
jgi:hypothetical protein